LNDSTGVADISDIVLVVFTKVMVIFVKVVRVSARVVVVSAGVVVVFLLLYSTLLKL